MTKGETPLPPEEHIHASQLEARELSFLEQARAGLSPSDEAVRRLRARIDGAVPNETTDIGAHEPLLRASYSRKVGTGLFGLGLGLGTALGYLWGQHDNEPVTPTPISSEAPAPTNPSPAPERPSVGQTPAAKPGSNGSLLDASTPPSSEPGARRSNTRHRVNTTKAVGIAGVGSEQDRAAPAGSSQTGPNADANEILLVQRVQRALARREPGVALGLLKELDAQVPGGRLREERAAGRAIALCMQGSPRANSAFEIFKRQFPTSVHLPRAAAACGTKETTNNTASSDESELSKQE